jgi:hypothetical protein
MTGSPSRASSKSLFQELKILTIPSQYILSLITFLLNNLHYYTFKSSVHETNTRKQNTASYTNS